MDDQLVDQVRQRRLSHPRSDEADARLVYKTLHKDKEAFGSIVVSYTPIFYSLIRHMGIRSQETIEDELQEIFLRIYKALPTFREGRSFFTWSYTIAMNWIRSQQRKNRAKRTINPIQYDEEMGILQGHRHSDAPEEHIVRSEARRILQAALLASKPIYRQVFVLRMIQGLSVSETAQVLHLPEGTVKTYLFRSREQLRIYLTEHHWDAKL
ncbi:MAG: sigma-70 family RNA polymerase sigma factor [Spirochaetales bacterium]|nr:sigma-70 family RNA polymerase sigma factor [Spirochaetales bacterium]